MCCSRGWHEKVLGDLPPGIPPDKEDWHQLEWVSVVQAHNFVVAYKEEEKKVVSCAFIPLIEDPFAWKVQLVVESSKNQFTCEPLNIVSKTEACDHE